MSRIKLPIILGLLFASVFAHAATFKIATLAPDGSNWMLRIKAGAKEVTEKTDGRVKFRFYPGGVMGDDKAVLRKMRIGQLQGAAVGIGSLAKFYSDSQIYNLVLKFRSLEEVDYVRRQMDPLITAGFEKGGLITFGISEGGFAYAMSQRPVKSIADLRQLKVWVPDNDRMGLVAMKTFGIKPIPLPIGDVLTGLQTGLINTIATSPVGAVALQWHNQISYITDLPLIYIYGTLAINNRDFKKLSASDQTIVRDAMGRAFADIDKQNRKDNLGALAALQNLDITLAKPNADELDEWRAKAEQSTIQLIAEGVVSQAMVDLLDKHLNAYRNQLAQNAP